MKILCVDDIPDQRETMCLSVRRFGYMAEAKTGIQAKNIDAAEALTFDAAIIDQKLEDGLTGESVGLALRQKNPRVVLIMLTAFATLERAVQAMKDTGFDDYIAKGTTDETNLIRKALLQAEKESGNRRTNEAVLKLLINRTLPEGINLIGEHPLFVDAVRQAITVAETDMTVLFLGESGTGKEEFAALIHKLSRRSSRKYVQVNCGAFAESLLESELFGHEKDSFNNAKLRKGRFEEADGGTMLLDEIGNMSLSAQQRLLRVLQKGTFERVGGNKAITVDVRIIAATNANLADSIKNKTFREDLFYRLNECPISLPPLRERGCDIRMLANKFRDEFASLQGGKPRAFAEDVLRNLDTYSWPGNVRDLKNRIKRAVVFARGKDKITSGDLNWEDSTLAKLVTRPSAATNLVHFATSTGHGDADTNAPQSVLKSENTDARERANWERLIEKHLDKMETAFPEALRLSKNAGQTKVRHEDLAKVMKCSRPMVGKIFRHTDKWEKIPGPARLELIRTLAHAPKNAKRWEGLRGKLSSVAKFFL